MTEHQTIDEKTLEGIAFAGRTLGPLFRHDPLLDREKVEALYVTLARSNPTALCEEWPFVAPDEALEPITDMVRGAKRFEDELAVDNESLAATSSLADEYRRLFVGPAKKAAAPWGSVYTDRDQVVFGLSTLELREWLRKNGIEVRRGESEEPEDHIGTMLELMAWLADNRPQLLGDYVGPAFPRPHAKRRGRRLLHGACRVDALHAARYPRRAFPRRHRAALLPIGIS